MPELTDIPKLNIQKSIEKERIIYQINGWLIFNTMFTYAFIFLFIAFSIILLIPDTVFLPGNQPIPLTYIISIIFNIWMIANFILVNKLIKIDRQQVSKKGILDAIALHEPDMKIVLNENDVIIFTTSGALSWGGILTILLTEEKLYVNFSSLGRGIAMVSPFHATYNYFKAKRIVEDIIKPTDK